MFFRSILIFFLPTISLGFHHSLTKRDNMGNLPTGTTADCFDKCMTQLKSRVQKDFPNYKEIEGKITEPLYYFNNASSVQLLDKFCTQLYQPSAQCFKACPQNAFTEIILGTLTVADYICINNLNNVKDNFVCLSRTFGNVTTYCRSEYDYFTITQAKNEQGPKGRDPTVQEKQNTLDEDCKAMVSLVTCFTTLAKKTCQSDKAVEIIQDLYARLLESVEHILRITMDNFVLPSSCKQISRDMPGPPPGPTPQSVNNKNGTQNNTIRQGGGSAPKVSTIMEIVFLFAFVTILRDIFTV